MNDTQFEIFFKSYLVTLLGSTAVITEDGDMLPLDEEYDISDINKGSLKEIKGHAREFYDATIPLFSETPNAYTTEQHGHDFALTSNGHGAGYWDRGLGTVGKELTEASKMYSIDLYIGDDNQLYC